MVDALRTMMVVGGARQRGLGTDVAVLAIGLVAMIAVDTRLYRRLAQ